MFVPRRQALGYQLVVDNGGHHAGGDATRHGLGQLLGCFTVALTAPSPTACFQSSEFSMAPKKFEVAASYRAVLSAVELFRATRRFPRRALQPGA